MLQEGVFEERNEIFSPKSAIDFVAQMFKVQSELENTKLYFDTVSLDSFNQVKDDYSLVSSHRQQMQKLNLPRLVRGDEIRLK